MIDDIQSNGADKIYIVGHSSGCAIANAVYAGLEYIGHHVLVALDGFTPSALQLDEETAQESGEPCATACNRGIFRASLTAQDLLREKLQVGVPAAFFPGQYQRQ